MSNNNDTETVNRNVGKIAERFLLYQFSAKTSHVDQWINEFESECARFVHDTEKTGY